MEPGGSLPHSQQPATCPYPEPVQSTPITTLKFQMNRNKIKETGCALHSAGLGHIPVFGFFEHGNKFSVFIKGHLKRH
jgi:hypothetical protein